MANIHHINYFESDSAFMTSLEVVQEVMSVPMAAIKTIARQENIQFENEQSACLDENVLGVYADAYVRKLKSYFNSMKNKNNCQLGTDDYLVFDEFCVNFKKPECNSKKACKWSDIDTDAIRKHFFALIKEKTPEKKPAIHSLFEGIGGLQIVRRVIPDFTLNLKFDLDSEESEETCEISEEKCNTLLKVNETYYRCTKEDPKPINLNCNARLRIVLFAAHYHIYSRSDKSDPDNNPFIKIILNEDYVANQDYTLLS